MRGVEHPEHQKEAEDVPALRTRSTRLIPRSNRMVYRAYRQDCMQTGFGEDCAWPRAIRR